jgi:hypothetical protein
MADSEIDVGQSYEYYRGLMDNPAARSLSMEFEGLDHENFIGAIKDPASVTLSPDSNQNIRVPLAVPIAYMPWYNQPYFEKLAAPRSPIYYYNNLPSLLDTQAADYVEAIKPTIDLLGKTGGLLATDHSHVDKPIVDRDIGYVASRAGAKAKDILEDVSPPARHYMYAEQLLHRDRLGPRFDETDIAATYHQALGAGYWAKERAELETTLPQASVDEVWGYYQEAFATHNNVDPVLASFSYQEFTEIMTSADFMKLVYRKDGAIANVCIMADIRFCPWMNQAYYQHNYPEAYAAGNVMYSPGVVSNPKTNSIAMSLSTMRLFIEIFCAAGTEPVITFVCDEVSNSQVPRLSAHSVNRTNVLTTDFSYPKAMHIIRAFSFKPT